jgi:hypothetical protein
MYIQYYLSLRPILNQLGIPELLEQKERLPGICRKLENSEATILIYFLITNSSIKPYMKVSDNHAPKHSYFTKSSPHSVSRHYYLDNGTMFKKCTSAISL